MIQINNNDQLISLNPKHQFPSRYRQIIRRLSRSGPAGFRSRPAGRQQVNFYLPFEGFTIARTDPDWLNQLRAFEPVWGASLAAGQPGLVVSLIRRLAWLMLVFGLALAGFILFNLTQINSSWNQVANRHNPARVNQALAGVEFKPDSSIRLQSLNPELTGDRFTVLIAGHGGPGHPGSDLTDSLQIISLSLNQPTGLVLTVPRDLYLINPITGVPTRVNSIYQQARYQAGPGLSLVDRQAFGLDILAITLEHYLGIDIDAYALINLDGFIELFQILTDNGSVSIEVPEAIYDQRSGLDVAAGQQLMDAETALAYSRARYALVNGDFSRGQHQRQLMLALRQRISQNSFLTNLFKIRKATEALEGNLITNLSLSQTKALYQLASQVPDEAIESIDLVSGPVLVTTASRSGQSVVVPRAGDDDFSQIQAFLRTRFELPPAGPEPES